MTRSTQTTRVINGEELVQRVRDTTNAFKAGRFLPLTTRPWVTNIYLMSRINYRSCALNLRQQDIQKIQSATKSWVTQGYLLKPNEVLLYRNPEEGGLGVIHTAARCKANLIKTFISQGDPSSQHSNSYLSALFRTYVSQELPADTIKKTLLLQWGLFHNDQGGVGGEERRAPPRHNQGVAEDSPGAGNHPRAGPAWHAGFDRN